MLDICRKRQNSEISKRGTLHKHKRNMLLEIYVLKCNIFEWHTHMVCPPSIYLHTQIFQTPTAGILFKRRKNAYLIKKDCITRLHLSISRALHFFTFRSVSCTIIYKHDIAHKCKINFTTDSKVESSPLHLLRPGGND